MTVAGLGLVLGLLLDLALGGLQPSGSSVRHAAIFIPLAAFFRLGIVSRQRQTLLAAGGAGWGCRCFWMLNWLRRRHHQAEGHTHLHVWGRCSRG